VLWSRDVTTVEPTASVPYARGVAPAVPTPLGADLLRREASALARYVLGRDAAPALLERYVAAHEHLDVGAVRREDTTVLDFALAHPWSLASLDSATALLRPHALLHRKALLMTAILETTPEHADAFLPRAVGWPALAWLAVRVGCSTAAHLVVGVPLLLVLRHR